MPSDRFADESPNATSYRTDVLSCCFRYLPRKYVIMIIACCFHETLCHSEWTSIIEVCTMVVVWSIFKFYNLGTGKQRKKRLWHPCIKFIQSRHQVLSNAKTLANRIWQRALSQQRRKCFIQLFSDISVSYRRKTYEIGVSLNNIFGNNTYSRYTISTTMHRYQVTRLRPRAVIAKVSFNF